MGPIALVWIEPHFEEVLQSNARRELPPIKGARPEERAPSPTEGTPNEQGRPHSAFQMPVFFLRVCYLLVWYLLAYL